MRLNSRVKNLFSFGFTSAKGFFFELCIQKVRLFINLFIYIYVSLDKNKLARIIIVRLTKL